MRNIETFPSKQMYPYLSLDERKVAEFYHNIDRRRWLVWLKWLIFINFSGQLMVSLRSRGDFAAFLSQNWLKDLPMITRWCQFSKLVLFHMKRMYILNLNNSHEPEEINNHISSHISYPNILIFFKSDHLMPHCYNRMPQPADQAAALQAG